MAYVNPEKGAFRELGIPLLDNVICASDADASAVRTALRTLLTELKAAGLMAPDPD